MAKRRTRPGSPKGQAKPPKRNLDPEFAQRMDQAMKQAVPRFTKASLARRAGCSRMTIGNYLKGKTNVDALTLFAVADALDVSARWLLKGDGFQGRGRPLSEPQHRALDLHQSLSPQWREYWIEQGELIKSRKLDS